MTARSFEQFKACLTKRYGAAWVAEYAAAYCRIVARDLRAMADANPEDAEDLRSLADRMDPDLTRPGQEVPDAAAHS